MSPGGDERAGPSPGSGSQPRSSFFVRADDGAMHAAGGPHGGRIVLAASLVLPVDVSQYFKRIETFCRPTRGPGLSRPRDVAEGRLRGGEVAQRGKTGGAIAPGTEMTLLGEGRKAFPSWKAVPQSGERFITGIGRSLCHGEIVGERGRARGDACDAILKIENPAGVKIPSDNCSERASLLESSVIFDAMFETPSVEHSEEPFVLPPEAARSLSKNLRLIPLSWIFRDRLLHGDQDREHLAIEMGIQNGGTIALTALTARPAKMRAEECVLQEKTPRRMRVHRGGTGVLALISSKEGG